MLFGSAMLWPQYDVRAGPVASYFDTIRQIVKNRSKQRVAPALLARRCYADNDRGMLVASEPNSVGAAVGKARRAVAGV